MRVTVLGGTGFIGHDVTRQLVESGTDVTVIHRGHTPARVPGARRLTADRRDHSALASALAFATPNVLIDMTAYTGGDIEHLVTAVPTSLERLVVISSGDVYWTYGAFLGLGPSLPASPPLDEGAPLREQLYPYRAQAAGMGDLRYWYEKVEVERTARARAGVPVTILRLPMVYGPGDPHRRVAGYLDPMVASGSELRLDPAEAGWRCTRGYVEDVAGAIRLAALDERASGEVFNVGEVDALTELEWARAIGAAAGWSGRVRTDPAQPPSVPANWEVPLVTDTGRIRRVLGYSERVGRAEGLRRSVARGPDRPRPLSEASAGGTDLSAGG
jgi:nucleoside-diphosphate-sugar epimerase